MSVALENTDGYKLSHKKFMRDGTTSLYANLTARDGRRAKFSTEERKVVWFGLQAFIKDFLIGEFNREFFNKPKEEALGYWKDLVESYLGPGSVDMDHFEALHDLGHLPILIKALPEGSRVSYKVPLMTWKPTDPSFTWLVGFLETVISQELWGPTTSATTAHQFRMLFEKYADETVGNRLHVPFQGHDFSARGMFGRHAAAMSGMGHLLSFWGTDTVSAIVAVNKYYGGYKPGTLIGTSVPASEHSVTSLGIAVDGELETLRNWITKAYPSGIVSLVSDTIDYWKVLTEYLPALKGDILARPANGPLPGKVVVRPDSGDPYHIICGYTEAELHAKLSEEKFTNPSDVDFHELLKSPEGKGSLELLWETFGGTVNELGYKVLNPAIGLIYGDSINLEKATKILERMKEMGFASSNVVFGLGSFTYQYVTRDTHSIAVKATAAVVENKLVELYKDPKTDDGTKKSARGLMRVDLVDGEFIMKDQVTPEEEAGGCLRPVFQDSQLLIDEPFDIMRERLVA